MARARVKAGTRTKNRAVRRRQATSHAKSATRARTVKKAVRPHKFVVSHLRPQDFATGLRSYAQYRDLGVKDATHGMAVAHVIRMIGPCDPKLVSKLHRHDAEFQMIYVLKGSITGEYGSHGVHTMKEGDAWLQPKNIKHRVLDYSDDCELLEIVMPANFKTVELEA
jgi:uncharacterized RmlC-like cupin family protein